MKKEHKTKHKTAKKAAAVVLAAATLIGGAVAADLPGQTDSINEPAPIVQMTDLDMPDTVAEQDEDEVKTEKKRSVWSSVIAYPVYGLGWMILRLLELLWSSVFPPVLTVILRWIIITAVVIGASAAALKLIFPERPLKELLTFKNIKLITGGVLIICILCALIPLAWPDCEKWINIVRAIGGMAALTPALVLLIKRANRKKQNA